MSNISSFQFEDSDDEDDKKIGFTFDSSSDDDDGDVSFIFNTAQNSTEITYQAPKKPVPSPRQTEPQSSQQSSAQPSQKLPLQSSLTQDNINQFVAAFNNIEPPKLLESPLITKLSRFDSEYSLESYKMLSQKVKLLTDAEKSRNSLAMLRVALFVQSTLSNELFLETMKPHRMAKGTLMGYYKATQQFDKLHLLRNEDNIVSKKLAHFYAQSPTISSNGAFSLEGLSPTNRRLFEQLHTHREMLAAIERNDSSMSNKVVLTDFSPLDLLSYCFMVHHSASPLNSASAIFGPAKVKVKLEVTDKEYQWAGVVGHSKARRWDALKAHISTKSLFGGLSLSPQTEVIHVAILLAKYGAPVVLQEELLAVISDASDRFNVASFVKAHKVAVDSLIDLRDREGLLKYASALVPGTPAQLHAAQALKSHPKVK